MNLLIPLGSKGGSRNGEMTVIENYRKGLGRAITNLKKSTNRENDKLILLDACLQNITYDPQSEGTKGLFLFEAITALGVENDFYHSIHNKFLKENEF